jgi:hypothetical protein
MQELFISLGDARDGAILIYSILGALLCLLLIILVALLIRAVLSAKGLIADLVNESVKPTLDSIKGTAESIKGTTDFMGEKAVSPVIRTYGMVSGVRRGLSVLTGLSKSKKE